jgi:hypothetical protein
MSHAFKPNEDVHHQPKGPQGRVATEPSMVYIIVQRIRASQRILSEWLRKISFRMLTDSACLIGVWFC